MDVLCEQHTHVSAATWIFICLFRCVIFSLNAALNTYNFHGWAREHLRRSKLGLRQETLSHVISVSLRILAVYQNKDKTTIETPELSVSVN